MEVNESINTFDIIISRPFPNCPMCNCNGEVIHNGLIDRLFGSIGKWNISKCSNPSCGQLWLNPMPNKDEIWKAYGKYYTHDDSKTNIIPLLRPLEQDYISLRFGYRSSTSYFKQIVSYLIYLFPTERAEIDIRIFYIKSTYGSKLLDIGCGDGSLIKRLSERGWDATGIDFDPKAIAHCKSKGLNVKVGDLISQNFSDDEFDVITLNHVIEHLFNPNEIFEECYRILKPGGRIIVATVNTDSWLYNLIFNSNWLSLDPPRHVMLYTKRSLSALIRKYNFRIEESRTTIRNEFYVFVGSLSIKKKGVFPMGQEKPNKLHILIGKFVQLLSWLVILFKRDSGGEIVIIAQKK